VYDLEWARGEWKEVDSGTIRTPEVRMAGVYDGRQFRWYRTINAFLDNELVPKNNGIWFYAHAGGLADMLFIMQRLIARGGTEVKASFSGSSAIIVQVRKGRHRWTFVDSLWLFGTALAKVAKWIGMKKGTIDFETDDFRKLVEYNELDCKILWRAIDAFETAILGMGGELCMTLASCAMNLFRRKFLTRSIETNSDVNLSARLSYFGSRVEVFEREAMGGYYFDINSSFPAAMIEPCPGAYIGSTRRLPTKNGALFLARIDVEVPETYFPTLPLRHEGSVFFPVGKWQGWFNETDCRLLESRGGKIHRVYEVNHFSPFTDLAEYATTLYDLRKQGTTEFENVIYKLLLNSLYGKFAENPLKQSLLVNPPFTTCPHWPPHPRKLDTPRESTCMTQLVPGVWLMEDEAEIPHEHVPISSHITALARANLYGHMEKCSRFYYCDTDGFATNEGNIPTSDKLGGLKLEIRFDSAEFLSPKVYRIDDKVKAKGMSLLDKSLIPETITTEEGREEEGKKISLKRWLKLREGETIEAERMSRIKELYRSGSTIPITRRIGKQLRFASRPKRKMNKNGTSRPWTIDELKEK
jgi:hypothetical protein